MLKIVLQLCSAVSYIHRNSIVHRDIKVSNLLFDADVNVQLCDFGFARFADTQQMTRLGTPAYIAPEVYNYELARELHKNVAEYDDRADTWSIGVVAYCLVTGKYPLDGGYGEIVR